MRKTIQMGNRKKKQYVEIRRIDWELIKLGFLMYPFILVINLFLGLYFILTAPIPFLNMKSFGEYAEGSYEYPSFYKKVKLEIKTSEKSEKTNQNQYKEEKK